MWGQNAMIDHLVEKYGVDPNRDVDEWDFGGFGRNALHWAVLDGRFRTVKHLVEKHNVDIHQRSCYGTTTLDFAVGLRENATPGRIECAEYLRGYGAKTGWELEEEDWTESDDGWDSDDSSDADHDVM